MAWRFSRGYTGHEHLPEVGLINMNGRMYDPLLGRMLSPDAYVQAPGYTQSYNRYSYCWNNPLKYTDPTGWEAWWEEEHGLPGVVIIGRSGGGRRHGDGTYLSPLLRDDDIELRVYRQLRGYGMPIASIPSIPYVSKTSTASMPSLPTPAPTPPPPAPESSGRVTAGVWGNVLDYFQLGLDVFGLVPFYGEFADLGNAGIYALRGDYLNAGLSLSAIIPVFGWAATGGKLTGKTAGKVAVKGGSNIAVQFGKTENQIYHAFRHTDALGLDRSLVQSTIQNHFKTVSSQVVAGKPFNQIIEIGGQRIQYTAFKLSDGTFNIGRIHGIN